MIFAEGTGIKFKFLAKQRKLHFSKNYGIQKALLFIKHPNIYIS